MADNNRVVVHHKDGRIQKGTTGDFFPNKAMFHLSTEGGRPVEIETANLKAVFFVRDLKGNADRAPLPGFLTAPGETAMGKKVAIRFHDGELLCGYTMAYAPERAGFFITPADSGSNNIRIYIVSASASEIAAGPAADILVQKSVSAPRSR
jgi:hypothetical protein